MAECLGGMSWCMCVCGWVSGWNVAKPKMKSLTLPIFVHVDDVVGWHQCALPTSAQSFYCTTWCACCSDGSGRTGTYCLIDLVLNRIFNGKLLYFIDDWGLFSLKCSDTVGWAIFRMWVNLIPATCTSCNPAGNKDTWTLLRVKSQYLHLILMLL